MKERILVLVRACPEKSRKHGHRVCVAGITERGEWRRLYPFPFSYGKGLIGFRKRDIIEADVTIPGNDKRSESRKVKAFMNLHDRKGEKEVMNRIAPLTTSIERLESLGASLGVVKPDVSDLEVRVNSTAIMDKQAYLSAAGDFLERREKVKMPVEVRY